MENNKDLLFLTIAILVTVAIWIGFQAYHTYENHDTPATQVSTQPLNVTIRNDVFQQLESSQP